MRGTDYTREYEKHLDTRTRVLSHEEYRVVQHKTPSTFELSRSLALPPSKSFKIQQQRERSYSKSSNRERRVIQNPARERDELLKIQQERERSYSKSSKKERGVTQSPATQSDDLFKIALLEREYECNV